MKKTKLMNRIIVLALFVFYMYALLKIILFKFDSIDMTFLWHQLQENLGNPVRIMNRLQLGNFIPFKSISNNIQSLSGHDVINLVGNIAVFIPFGMFLVLLSKNKGMSFIGVLAQSLSLSLCLEFLQVVFFIGSFDVDDLILNTSGGLLGYSAFKLYDKFKLISLSVIIALIVGGSLLLLIDSKDQVVSIETVKQIKEAKEFDEMLRKKDFLKKVKESLKVNGFETVAMVTSSPSAKRLTIDIYLQNEPNNKIKKEIESIVKTVGKENNIDFDSLTIKVKKYEEPKSNG